MKASQGKVVSVHYTLRDGGGTVLDSSEGDSPLVYLHGHDGLLPGLERAIEGMEAGDRSQVVLAPGDAYGERDPEAVLRATRDQFPDDIELAPGLEVAAHGPEGPVTFRVVEVTDDGAVLDGNHPLAGVELHFALTVLDVREATADELEHGHVHGPGGHHG